MEVQWMFTGCSLDVRWMSVRFLTDARWIGSIHVRYMFDRRSALNAMVHRLRTALKTMVRKAGGTDGLARQGWQPQGGSIYHLLLRFVSSVQGLLWRLAEEETFSPPRYHFAPLHQVVDHPHDRFVLRLIFSVRVVPLSVTCNGIEVAAISV